MDRLLVFFKSTACKPNNKNGVIVLRSNFYFTFSPFNNKLGCFSNKIKKIVLQKNLSFCRMGKLSGKPLTPLSLKSSMVQIIVEKSRKRGWRRPIGFKKVTQNLYNFSVADIDFVCSYHPAAQGLNPKHTIDALFSLYSVEMKLYLLLE